MIARSVITITTLLLLSTSVLASCFVSTKSDMQPNNVVDLKITKDADQDAYTVMVIKKTYHLGVKLKSMTLVQKTPYLEVKPIIYPLNPTNEALVEGKGFVPNTTANKEELYSYVSFIVKAPEEINNFEVKMVYGSNVPGCSSFTIAPVAKLQYNQVLKVQPSAAGDAASGAP